MKTITNSTDRRRSLKSATRNYENHEHLQKKKNAQQTKSVRISQRCLATMKSAMIMQTT